MPSQRMRAAAAKAASAAAEPVNVLGRGGEFPIRPGTVIDDTEIIELVSHTNMGYVFRGIQHRIGRRVAIKVLAPALASDLTQIFRFQNSARATGLIDHRNVVKVYDVGKYQGMSYMIMQWVDGQPLDDLLGRRGKLPLDEVIDIGVQAAKGLAAAHRHQIVHRDIKPSNLMLMPDGMVKVIDFGVALMPEIDDKLTHTGEFIGTPEFASPEQIDGQHVDHRADIFSLGSTLFTLLTGRPPYENNLPIVAKLLEQLENPFPDILEIDPSIPVEFAELLDRMSAKDPSARIQNMDDVAAALMTIRSASAYSFCKPPPMLSSVPFTMRLWPNGTLVAVFREIDQRIAIEVIEKAHAMGARRMMLDFRHLKNLTVDTCLVFLQYEQHAGRFLRFGFMHGSQRARIAAEMFGLINAFPSFDHEDDVRGDWDRDAELWSADALAVDDTVKLLKEEFAGTATELDPPPIPIVEESWSNSQPGSGRNAAMRGSGSMSRADLPAMAPPPPLPTKVTGEKSGSQRTERTESKGDKTERVPIWGLTKLWNK